MTLSLVHDLSRTILESLMHALGRSLPSTERPWICIPSGPELFFCTRKSYKYPIVLIALHFEILCYPYGANLLERFSVQTNWCSQLTSAPPKSLGLVPRSVWEASSLSGRIPKKGCCSKSPDLRTMSSFNYPLSGWRGGVVRDALKKCVRWKQICFILLTEGSDCESIPLWIRASDRPTPRLGAVGNRTLFYSQGSDCESIPLSILASDQPTPIAS